MRKTEKDKQDILRSALHVLRSAFSPSPSWLWVVFPLSLLWRALFAGEAFFWGTPLLQFVPWQRMAASMWRSGRLPLWNPLVGCGAPLAANYQTGAFYPLNVLHLLLPAEVALGWTVAFHLALAGWGMYRWARAVGLDRFPASIGALALEGSGFLVARAALFPSTALTFPWLAIWLWRAEVLMQSERTRDALWLGLTLGLGLLAGHAQTAFYGGLLLAAYVLFRTMQTAGSGKQEAGSITFDVLRFAFHVAVALLVGVGLAAVQLLPTAALMQHSQRSTGVAYDFAMNYSLWPWRLITFVAPGFFGLPGRGTYWGYAAHWEDAGYVGLLPLLLAIHAIVMTIKEKHNTQHAIHNIHHVSRSRSTIGFWLLTAVITLVLALGKNTPVFPFLFRHVPTFDLFQAPTRWLAIVTVALSALSALGAQRWPRGHAARRRGALAVTVGGAFFIGGLAAPRLVPGVRSTFGPATARLGVALAAAGALTLLRREAAWWRAATITFIALDLLLFGRPLVPTVDRSLYAGTTETANTLHSDGDSVRVYWPTDPDHLNQEYDGQYRVKFDYLTFDDFGPRDADHWRGMRRDLIPNAGMLDGLATVNNFDPLLVGRYVDLLEAAIETPSLLRVMGTTHVVSDEPWPAGEEIAGCGARLADCYRLPKAPGRAWIVPAARRVPADEMPDALADPAFDPAAEVLLESEPRPARSQPSEPYKSHIHSLQVTPNRVTIEAEVETPGYLVLADTWYPGWRASVDGERVELLRANYAFRAVLLETGRHVVKMLYRPPSVFIGGVVSLIALALLAAGLLSTRRASVKSRDN